MDIGALSLSFEDRRHGKQHIQQFQMLQMMQMIMQLQNQLAQLQGGGGGNFQSVLAGGAPQVNQNLGSYLGAGTLPFSPVAFAQQGGPYAPQQQNYPQQYGSYQSNRFSPLPQGGAGTTQDGLALARAADQSACRTDTVGMCYAGVKPALAAIGVHVTGGAAYEAADQLARNPKMREVSVPRSNLSHLPPGAVVVWNPANSHPYGHISVALGNGQEASDHIQHQVHDLTGGGDGYRVFMPV
jgi:hypothetical protein